jgi:hypothetical protein
MLGPFRWVIRKNLISLELISVLFTILREGTGRFATGDTMAGQLQHWQGSSDKQGAWAVSWPLLLLLLFAANTG